MIIKYLKAIFFQSSAIIGAGIYALPFLFSQSNFYISLIILLVSAGFFSLIHFFYCEIVLKTKGDHQLPGYTQIYFGRTMKNIVLISILIMTFGAFGAYLKLIGDLFAFLIPSANSQLVTLLFVISLIGLKMVEKKLTILEYIPAIVIGMVIFLFLKTNNLPTFINHNYGFSWSIVGSIFFALSGFTIIPEIEELFRKEKLNKKNLKLISLLGLWLVLFIYIYFVISILAITGDNTTADTITGVFQKNMYLAKFISVIGIITITKSSLNFLALSKEIFYRDLKIKKEISMVMSALIPVAIYLLSPFEFEKIIEFVGLVPITILMMVIFFIYIKLNRFGIK